MYLENVSTLITVWHIFSEGLLVQSMTKHKVTLTSGIYVLEDLGIACFSDHLSLNIFGTLDSLLALHMIFLISIGRSCFFPYPFP